MSILKIDASIYNKMIETQ